MRQRRLEDPRHLLCGFEDYAICVAKENTKLLDELNKAIDELTADGTIDAIVAKYIK